MEKINARKGEGGGDKESDGGEEEPWKKRNFRDRKERKRGGTSRLTRDETTEIRVTKNAREKRMVGVARLLCKENVAFFSRVSVRFILHSKALWINIALHDNARVDQRHSAYYTPDYYVKMYTNKGYTVLGPISPSRFV